MKKLIAAITGLFAGRRRRPISEEVAVRAAEDGKFATAMAELEQGLRDSIVATIHPEFKVLDEPALVREIPWDMHLRLPPGANMTEVVGAGDLENRLASIEARLDRIESGEAHKKLQRRRIV